MNDGWVEQAACAHADSDLFFSPDRVDQKMSGWSPEPAYAICATCPVRVECLVYAYEQPHSRYFGIYGATRPRERRRDLLNAFEWSEMNVAMVLGTRRCSSCRTKRPIAEFSRWGPGRYGYTCSHCRAYDRKRLRERKERQDRKGNDMGKIATASSLLAAILFLASPALGSDVCPPGDSGKIDMTGDPTSVTVTAPAGFVIVQACVKAGSSNQGLGPEFYTYSPGQQTVTLTHSSGKAISHYSVEWEEIEDEEITSPSPTVSSSPSPSPIATQAIESPVPSPSPTVIAPAVTVLGTPAPGTPKPDEIDSAVIIRRPLLPTELAYTGVPWPVYLLLAVGFISMGMLLRRR